MRLLLPVKKVRSTIFLRNKKSGVILGVNEQALNLFGYQRKAMIGKPLTMLMTQEYSDRHDGYMQTYNITNNRRLVGKARTLPALHADGTTINVVLSLGEIESEGQRRFIATIRPAQNTSRGKKFLEISYSCFR